MAKFQVRPAFSTANPDAVTLVDGVVVALIGKEITVERTGTLTHPPMKRVVRGATQAELKYLFETEHNPHIELVEEKEK